MLLVSLPKYLLCMSINTGIWTAFVNTTTYYFRIELNILFRIWLMTYLESTRWVWHCLQTHSSTQEDKKDILFLLSFIADSLMTIMFLGTQGRTWTMCQQCKNLMLNWIYFVYRCPVSLLLRQSFRFWSSEIMCAKKRL